MHVEDRGFQFADGIYEVWAVLGGRLSDAEGFPSAWRVRGEPRCIPEPMSRPALEPGVLPYETVRRNCVRDGLVYLQITRGVARRDHAFPDPAPTPTVVVISNPSTWRRPSAKRR